MNYEQLKQKYPKLNWQEAEEIDDDDLEATSDYWKRIVNKEPNTIIEWQTKENLKKD